MLTYERTHRPDADGTVWNTEAISTDQGLSFRLTIRCETKRLQSVATRDAVRWQEQLLLLPYWHNCNARGCPPGRFEEKDHETTSSSED